MISGNCQKKIKGYLPIDRFGEGLVYVCPGSGEEFIGIPYQWLSENSMPLIEHRKDGILIRTINAIDVAVIEFEI